MRGKLYKTGVFLLSAVLAFAMLAACGKKQCNHSYRMTDYVAPTATGNGRAVYTCSECNNSYSEVIPATGSTTAKQDTPTPSPDGGYSSTSRTIRLFDLPIYSENGSSAVATLNYESETMDSRGYKHTDCYLLCTSQIEHYEYIRYELGGKYSTLSGTIYSYTNNIGPAWLEFYDGEDFLFSTARLSENSQIIEFEFDITGVNYLTVYPRCESAYSGGNWIITDQITITK